MSGTIMLGTRAGSYSEGDGNIYFGSDSGRMAFGSQNMYFGDSAKAMRKILDEELKYKDLNTGDNLDKINSKKYEKYGIGEDYTIGFKSYGNRNLVFGNSFIITYDLEKESRYVNANGEKFVKIGNDFYNAEISFVDEIKVSNETFKKELSKEFEKQKKGPYCV